MDTLDLDLYKIPVIEGINDSPVPPNFEENGLGCNGAYFIDKFHEALDSIETYLADTNNYYALYPEKVIPFVPEDPEVLTYGIYSLTTTDFACTLTTDSNLGSGYTLDITIPSGLALEPGLQTYIAIKGGCRFSLVGGVGVTLTKFNQASYLESGQVWLLVCTGIEQYSLYRLDYPSEVSANKLVGQDVAGANKYYGTNDNGDTGFHSLPTTTLPIGGLIESPQDKIYPLYQATVPSTIQSLRLKTFSGTCTVDIQINDVSVLGLSALTVTSTSQLVTATSLNVVGVGDRVTLVVTEDMSPADLEYTLMIQV